MSRSYDQAIVLDETLAHQMVDVFASTTGVACFLADAKGEELYRREAEYPLCAECSRIIGRQACREQRIFGAGESERFGGRYIYFCPIGMGYCISPVILGGKMVGAVGAGPIMVMEPEDLLAGTSALRELPPGEKLTEVTEFLQKFPRREPDDLSRLSVLLLATVLYIGGERRSLLERRRTQDQYRDIGEHIQQLKLEGVKTAYPLDTERGLIHAISEGDLSEARALLNELLGYIFFASGGDFAIMRTRSLELMVLLSRAAVESGVELEETLELNRRFLKESDYLRTTDELTMWLTKVIERYATLVFDLVDVKHKDSIYKAIHYMKRNFAGKLTLENTARHVGFSPTYFSKIFKEEMGTTFNSYLGNLRVEQSKALLLTDDRSVGEICAAVGFEDQSYFIKVFRRYTGVTPGKYRKKQGRLDSQKEHGLVKK